MRIVAQDISKLLGVQWVIRSFSAEFEASEHYAIRGSNGSGKSTLLQLISTFLEPSTGSVAFYSGNENIPLDQAHRFFSVAAPYLDFIPHFSIDEQILFTERVKGLSDRLTREDVLKIMELDAHRNKRLSELSSGMKQRVRLVVSLSANVPFVFLDEPTTNLDDRSKQWYLETVRHLGESKGLVIASNDERDLETCTSSYNVEDYKDRL